MIRKYLSQQYPREENKWKIILPVSLFIALFVLIFQPFGLSNYQNPHKFLILAGYGFVTLIILAVDLIVLPFLFQGSYREEKWTVLKEIFYLVFILVTIGLGNLLYSAWMIGIKLSLANILIFQVFTVAIGIIPITAITLIKQNYLFRKYSESAARISSSLSHQEKDIPMNDLLKITSESGTDEVSLLISSLVFVKSEGNYITVGYLKNGRIAKTLLRNTMKYAEERLSCQPSVFKCHRSWLVNLDKIERVSGNSQGLKLSMEGYEEHVPVARNLAGEFKRIIQERSV